MFYFFTRNRDNVVIFFQLKRMTLSRNLKEMRVGKPWVKLDRRNKKCKLLRAARIT